MIDKSYAAMQYALFIKDVKDKFFCLLVRKEKTILLDVLVSKKNAQETR